MLVKEDVANINIPKLSFINPIDLRESVKELWTQGSRKQKRRAFYIHEEPGIYIFFNNRMEIMYIGKSINLKARFRQHMSKARNSSVYRAMKEDSDNIVYYSYAICKDDYEASMYEMIYTYMYRPKLNMIWD